MPLPSPPTALAPRPAVEYALRLFSACMKRKLFTPSNEAHAALLDPLVAIFSRVARQRLDGQVSVSDSLTHGVLRATCELFAWRASLPSLSQRKTLAPIVDCVIDILQSTSTAASSGGDLTHVGYRLIGHVLKFESSRECAVGGRAGAFLARAGHLAVTRALTTPNLAQVHGSAGGCRHCAGRTDRSLTAAPVPWPPFATKSLSYPSSSSS